MSNGLVVSDIERRRRECRIRNEASRIRGNDACGHGYPNWYSRVAMCEGLTKSGYVQTGLTAPKHRRTCCAHVRIASAPLPLWRHPTQPVRHDPFNTARHYGPFNTSRSARPSSQVPRAVASASADRSVDRASLGLSGVARSLPTAALAAARRRQWRSCSHRLYTDVRSHRGEDGAPLREGFDAVADWGSSRGQGPRRVPQPPGIGHRSSSDATPFAGCGGQLEKAIVR